MERREIRGRGGAEAEKTKRDDFSRQKENVRKKRKDGFMVMGKWGIWLREAWSLLYRGKFKGREVLMERVIHHYDYVLLQWVCFSWWLMEKK